MRRGLRHAWLGLGVIMALLPALPAPAAYAATGSWEFETQSYDFGSVLPGSHASHQFALTNTGESPIAVGRWTLRWRLFGTANPELFHVISNGCAGRVLEPEESCSVGLSFNPTYPGPMEGEFVLPSSSGEASTAILGLQGEANGPVVAIEPEHLLLGVVQAGSGVSPPQSVIVKNQGNLGLTIEDISFTDLAGAPQSPSPFRIVGGSCQRGTVIAPEGACTIEVSLAPPQAGTFESRLAISDNAYGPPQSVEVRGVGTPNLGLAEPPRPSHPRVPAPRIIRHPARVTQERTATFWFSVKTSNSPAECELDHLGFKPCTSPKRYVDLSRGRHNFLVRLRAASGSSGSASSHFRWRIRPRS